MQKIRAVFRDELKRWPDYLYRYFMFAIGGVCGGIVYAVMSISGVQNNASCATGICVGLLLGIVINAGLNLAKCKRRPDRIWTTLNRRLK